MKSSINTKKLMINAILLAIGALLHQLTPALGLPMEPDFALMMLFIVVIINAGDYKMSFAAGLVTGVLTALTTKFPGGQLPNVIDKIVTVSLVLLIMYLLNKVSVIKNMNSNKRNLVLAGFIMPIGTLISGSVFLYSAMLIVGLPAPFMALFVAVVLPAVVINTVAGVFLLKLVQVSLKRAIAA